MILSVQPRIWLGQDVGTFEVLPPERGIGRVLCRGHLAAVSLEPQDEDGS